LAPARIASIIISCWPMELTMTTRAAGSRILMTFRVTPLPEGSTWAAKILAQGAFLGQDFARRRRSGNMVKSLIRSGEGEYFPARGRRE
jgi:hypothetical protein